MQIIRQDNSFADAIMAMLEAHRSKVFSVVTTDGKQERGYAPVIIGRDYLQCQSSLDERTSQRVYPFSAIVSVTPSG